MSAPLPAAVEAAMAEAIAEIKADPEAFRDRLRDVTVPLAVHGKVTLTNAQGDSITIVEGHDPLTPMSADEAERVQCFLARCAGWTVDDTEPSD